MIEAERTPETSVYFNETTWLYNPEKYFAYLTYSVSGHHPAEFSKRKKIKNSWGCHSRIMMGETV
jgi:hypothetical protein